jgi:hypothetical protein
MHVSNPNTCALRLSFALHHAIPGRLAAFPGTTWATRRGLRLARGAKALAQHIRDASGWNRRVMSPTPGGHHAPPGQGIIYWKGVTEADYHIDLWDRDRHLDAIGGLCMLWRPSPERTQEVWYWQLDPPRTMIFGRHELGERGTYR